MKRTIILKKPRITLPYRLRHPYIRASRVTAVQCPSCLQWVKPRYLRVPVYICKWCETAGLNQYWTPSPAHLARARAHADAAREHNARDGRHANVTLAGR